ncbi:MAG: hypothetical protein AAF541_15370 [Pseudomonadota bacterium]
MSDSTLLLEFTGRKSGRRLSTPISYHINGGFAHCFTNRNFHWWRNLQNGQTVGLRVSGKSYQSAPEVETQNLDVMRSALNDFLRAVPRDAAHAGVKLDKLGNPDQQDIHQVVNDMVYLKFPIDRDRVDT